MLNHCPTLQRKPLFPTSGHIYPHDGGARSSKRQWISIRL